MSEQYVEPGYVEHGYVEGGSFSLPEGGSVRLRHFVSNGVLSTEELMTKVQSEISEKDEVALVFLPEEKSIAFGTKDSYEMFNAGQDLSSIAPAIAGDEQFINKLAEKVSKKISVDFTASIVSKDGDIVSGAIVRQTGDRSFEIEVPDSLVATGYKLIISEV